jgi:signal transduction histidine kinase
MRAEPTVDGVTMVAPLGGPAPFRLQDVDLHAAITGCVTRHRALAGDRVVIFVPYRLRVQADPDALDTVLCSLLLNALKFAPPTSPIQVTAISDETQVVISVRDAGPGIPREMRGRILAGRRSGRSPEKGLARARRLVEGHGGQIWVEQAPEGGAAVSFTLPRVEARTRGLRAAPAAH